MTGNSKTKKGFTLVELLVSAFIFSLVFGAATGILVNSMKIQKFNLSHQQLLDQTSYAAEYMVRSLRMAKKDSFGGASYENITGGIRFYDYNDQLIQFYLDGSTNQLMVNNSSFSSGPVPLIPDDYEVTELSFVIEGDSAADNLQPKVTFFITVQDNNLVEKPRVALQTTVSQRNLDDE